MKTVCKDMCHLWANQLQAHARYGNKSFSGDLFYSYSACIARTVSRNRSRYYLLDSVRSYSVTTSRRVGEVRRAIPNGCIVFHVPNPDRPPCREHLNSYAERIRTLEIQAANAKSRRADLIAQGEALVAEANMFATVFGFQRRFTFDSDPASVKAAVTADQEEKLRKHQAAERSRSRSVARKLRDDQARLQGWMAGEDVAAPSSLPFQYMRVRGEWIETTTHARVRKSDVIRAAPLVLRAMASGVSHTRLNCPIGEFFATSIVDNVLTVGCHRFERAEIERIATLLGIQADAAAAGDDVCDTCMRSGVAVSAVDDDGKTVCGDCSE